MYQLLIAALLITSVSGGPVFYRNCEEGQQNTVLSLDIDDCFGGYCRFGKSSSIVYTATFIANQNSSALIKNMFVEWWAFRLDRPNLDTDGCKQLSCPLRMGMAYTINHTYSFQNIEILEYITPASNFLLTASLIGDNGPLVCAQFLADIYH